MAEPRASDVETGAVKQAAGSARTLASSMPRLILEARRVAASIIHGLHGRRRAGPGENFWQYRRFTSGEPAAAVDWRRSARDDHLYVREHEWEASHTIWLWPDRSPSMAFASVLSTESKLDRALVVAFALAEILVQGGERVGVPGLMRPTASRNVIEKMAEAILHDPTERTSLPPSFAPSTLSDLWAPIGDVQGIIAQLSATGAHGHVVQIVDPAEESFPYSGRIEFIEPEGAGSVTAGRAETWRNDYQGIVERHRAAIRAETDLRGWSFAIHRTDRPASELLLVLHSRMGDSTQPVLINSRHALASPASAACSAHCRLALPNLWFGSGCSACGYCGGCCGWCRPARGASIFRRRVCCSRSLRRKKRRRERPGGSRCCGLRWRHSSSSPLPDLCGIHHLRQQIGPRRC